MQSASVEYRLRSNLLISSLCYTPGRCVVLVSIPDESGHPDFGDSDVKKQLVERSFLKTIQGGSHALKRLSKCKIKEVFRLKFEQGHSKHTISRSCGIGRSTVNDYLQRAKQAGIVWALNPGKTRHPEPAVAGV